MKVLIDIPEKTYHMISENVYDYGDMNVIIQNGKPISDNDCDDCIHNGVALDEMIYCHDCLKDIENHYQKGGKE